MMSKKCRFLMVLCGVGILAACGQTGKLYLPPQQKTKTTTASEQQAAQSKSIGTNGPNPAVTSSPTTMPPHAIPGP
jgi:predicted small lipoprotein YifL